MAELDPDALALLYVQQYLAENGYDEALAALERQAGIIYDSDKLPQGSELMQLLWRKVGEEAAAGDSGAARVLTVEEEEDLMRSSEGECPCTVSRNLADVHRSNVTCVRLVPGSDRVLTGAGDGFVRCIGFDGTVHWQAGVGAGGLLTLDLHPGFSHGKPWLLAGSMDGSVSVLDATSGTLLGTAKPHTKYVVKATWARGGDVIVSASYDQSVRLLSVRPAGDGDAVKLEETQALQYPTAVQDVAILGDGVTAVVALRDTNYLRVFDVLSASTSNCDSNNEFESKGEARVNMNEAGDDHVSFYAMQLQQSPCGRFLLVATEGPRLLVLRIPASISAASAAASAGPSATAGPFGSGTASAIDVGCGAGSWQHVRTIYGLPVQQFHKATVAWHGSSRYVYAAAAGAAIVMFHVATGKVVRQLAGHSVNVRDMQYDRERNLLVTGSFDKSVKIWGVADGSNV